MSDQCSKPDQTTKNKQRSNPNRRLDRVHLDRNNRSLNKIIITTIVNRKYLNPGEVSRKPNREPRNARRESPKHTPKRINPTSRYMPKLNTINTNLNKVAMKDLNSAKCPEQRGCHDATRPKKDQENKSTQKTLRTSKPNLYGNLEI